VSAAEKFPQPSAIEKFKFRDDELDVTRTEDGDVAVPLRQLCDAIGVDTEAQRQKLKEAPWATTSIIKAVAEDGKIREIVCLHRRSIPMWSASISPNKVRPEVRDKLIAYQKECADVLADHFLGKRGASGVMFSQADPTLLAILRSNTDAIAMMQEAQTAAEARILTIVSTQLKALESRFDHAPGGDFHTVHIGRTRASVVAGKMKHLVGLIVGDDESARASMRLCLYTQLFGHLGHTGRGRSIRAIPEPKYHVALAWFDERIHVAMLAAKHEEAAAPAQQTIPMTEPASDASAKSTSASVARSLVRRPSREPRRSGLR